jgi:hypothetical protein
MLTGMSVAVPAPQGSRRARPAYWFPLALSGVALLVPAALSFALPTRFRGQLRAG